jgi:hypothetical protein
MSRTPPRYPRPKATAHDLSLLLPVVVGAVAAVLILTFDSTAAVVATAVVSTVLILTFGYIYLKNDLDRQP